MSKMQWYVIIMCSFFVLSSASDEIQRQLELNKTQDYFDKQIEQEQEENKELAEVNEGLNAYVTQKRYDRYGN